METNGRSRVGERGIDVRAIDEELQSCMDGIGRGAWWLSNLRALLEAFPPDKLPDMDPAFGLMWTLEDALFRALVVQVANLNDPGSSGGGSNRSFRTHLARGDFQSVKSDLASQIESIRPVLSKIEHFRNTAVAHSDPKGDWAEAPSLDEIEAVLRLMDEMLKMYFERRRFQYRNSCFMSRSKHVVFGELAQAAARVPKE